MKLEIALLLLVATVCVDGFISRNRSGYDCRRQCGYGRRYVCSTDGNTYDNECMMKCNWAYKSCDGRCPCYRPKLVVNRLRPVVNYKPRQPVNNYEQRQPVNNYEPRQPVNNYEPWQSVNNYDSSQPVNNYESSQMVNYQSPPDSDPIPVYTDPIPVYYEAPVQGDCVCSKEKDYVCTYDGETYDNECEANCDGKAKMCDGTCPCS